MTPFNHAVIQSDKHGIDLRLELDHWGDQGYELMHVRTIGNTYEYVFKRKDWAAELELLRQANDPR